MSNPLTPDEAQLAIVETLTDLLIELGSDDPDATEFELQALEESMGDVADLVVETFGLKVLSVEGSVALVQMTIPPYVEDEE